jgi:thiazole synthase ThiGH ThiG subunit
VETKKLEGRLTLYGLSFENRLLLKTARYDSPSLLADAIGATEIPFIIDGGIGLPLQACQVMEWGFDGVLLNKAVSRATDSVRMASAFADAVKAGRNAFLAGPMIEQVVALSSTPEIGRPFALNG